MSGSREPKGIRTAYCLGEQKKCSFVEHFKPDFYTVKNEFKSFSDPLMIFLDDPTHMVDSSERGRSYDNYYHCVISSTRTIFTVLVYDEDIDGLDSGTMTYYDKEISNTSYFSLKYVIATRSCLQKVSSVSITCLDSLTNYNKDWTHWSLNKRIFEFDIKSPHDQKLYENAWMTARGAHAEKASAVIIAYRRGGFSGCLAIGRRRCDELLKDVNIYSTSSLVALFGLHKRVQSEKKLVMYSYDREYRDMIITLEALLKMNFTPLILQCVLKNNVVNTVMEYLNRPSLESPRPNP